MADYFRIFGIDRTFGVDPDSLERRFHELQSESHPDRHVNAEDSRRSRALTESSEINRAYRTLRDPLARAKHLLSLYDLSVSEQKQVPPGLLMIVMEAQEKIAELEMTSDPLLRQTVLHELTAVAEELEGKRITLDEERARISREWDTNMHSETASELTEIERELLGRVSQILAQRAYLETLHFSVQAARTGKSAMVRH